MDLDDDVRGKTRNPANIELIRKFNYRSSRVLKACLNETTTEKSSTNGSMMSLGALLPSTSNDTQNRMQNKRVKLSLFFLNCRLVFYKFVAHIISKSTGQINR